MEGLILGQALQFEVCEEFVILQDDSYSNMRQTGRKGLNSNSLVLLLAILFRCFFHLNTARCVRDSQPCLQRFVKMTNEVSVVVACAFLNAKQRQNIPQPGFLGGLRINACVDLHGLALRFLDLTTLSLTSICSTAFSTLFWRAAALMSQTLGSRQVELHCSIMFVHDLTSILIS